MLDDPRAGYILPAQMPAKTARQRAAPELRVVAPRKRAPRPAAAIPIAEVRTMSLPFIAGGGGTRNWLRDRLLVTALAASFVLHAVVLALRFAPFDLSMHDRNGPPLEVALVNAKSKSKPTKAEILAQHHLDGGGNTDANRRAKSPLPVLPHESENTELALATQKVEALEQHAKELMTQLRSQSRVAAPQPLPTEVQDPPELPSAAEIMQRTMEAVRLEAQIAKEMDAYAKRPKRRFVGARAEEYRFARYVEDWRMKVERIGNLNYPEAARSACGPTAASRASRSTVLPARKSSISRRGRSSRWRRRSRPFRPTSGATPTSSTSPGLGRSRRATRSPRSDCRWCGGEPRRAGRVVRRDG
jgi:hypothetical protein